MKQHITLLAIAGLLAAAATLPAQQTAQYSLYMMTPLNWNPAYAGMDNSLSITAGIRRQWAGLEGSPSSQYVDAHLPLYFLRGGVGISFENDLLGAERLTTTGLAYNYQVPLGAGILSLGGRAAFVQRSLDGSRIRTPDGIYGEPGSISHQDDLLPLGQSSGQVPAFGAGAYFQSERYNAGLSVNNINQGSADLNGLNLQLARHYFFTFGANFDLSSDFTLHPSLILRSDLVQLQTDVSAIVRYNDNFFAGASFRGYNSNSIDAVAMIFGLNLSSNIRMAYAYDLTLSGLRAVSNGSHEVMLSYNLNKRIGAGQPPRIIYNPRSL